MAVARCTPFKSSFLPLASKQLLLLTEKHRSGKQGKEVERETAAFPKGFLARGQTSHLVEGWGRTANVKPHYMIVGRLAGQGRFRTNK